MVQVRGGCKVEWIDRVVMNGNGDSGKWSRHWRDEQKKIDGRNSPQIPTVNAFIDSYECWDEFGLDRLQLEWSNSTELISATAGCETENQNFESHLQAF